MPAVSNSSKLLQPAAVPMDSFCRTRRGPPNARRMRRKLAAMGRAAREDNHLCRPSRGFRERKQNGPLSAPMIALCGQLWCSGWPQRKGSATEAFARHHRHLPTALTQAFSNFVSLAPRKPFGVGRCHLYAPLEELDEANCVSLISAVRTTTSFMRTTCAGRAGERVDSSPAQKLAEAFAMLPLCTPHRAPKQHRTLLLISHFALSIAFSRIIAHFNPVPKHCEGASDRHSEALKFVTISSVDGSPPSGGSSPARVLLSHASTNQPGAPAGPLASALSLYSGSPAFDCQCSGF